jgi:hypothetical protein
MPTIAEIPRRRRLVRPVAALPRLRRLARADAIPVERETHEVDPERVELCEALLQRAGAVGDPRVVVDPVADAGRGVGARRHEGRHHGDEQAEENDALHEFEDRSRAPLALGKAAVTISGGL